MANEFNIKMMSGQWLVLTKYKHLIMLHTGDINMQLPAVAMRYTIDPTCDDNEVAFRLMNINDPSFAMTWYLDSKNITDMNEWLKAGFIPKD